jgi:hypothetical protein
MNFSPVLSRSAALIGYLATSYLLAMIVVAILFAALSAFDAGFAILSFIGFLTVGLAFSIPVFLIVAGLVVVLQKFILNHLAAWAFTAPFLVAVIFLVTSDWLRPAEPQIWIYAVFAFIWSAVASPLFCFFVKRSRWI